MIPRKTIFAHLRFAHAFVFELKFDGSMKIEALKFPGFDLRVFGALIGHCIALGESGLAMARELALAGKLSPEKLAEFTKDFSTDKVFGPLGDYMKARADSDLLPLFEGMVDAKRKTFDRHGCSKETTATRIYRAIFDDWTEVEELSGPTQLCKFLDSTLSAESKDPDRKLERVKKICARMGIIFRPKASRDKVTPSAVPSVE